MVIDLLKDRGTPIDQQRFTWKDLVQSPYSKLDDDAFTRVRVILMNGIESEALRFSHACARMNRDLQLDLARIRRIEQHQQTLVNWLDLRGQLAYPASRRGGAPRGRERLAGGAQQRTTVGG